jgi:hypothetical protein
VATGVHYWRLVLGAMGSFGISIGDHIWGLQLILNLISDTFEETAISKLTPD